MSRKKSEKDMRNVPITVRLNEEEHEKLKQCAAAWGLLAAEFMRQLCKGVQYLLTDGRCSCEDKVRTCPTGITTG